MNILLLHLFTEYLTFHQIFLLSYNVSYKEGDINVRFSLFFNYVQLAITSLVFGVVYSDSLVAYNSHCSSQHASPLIPITQFFPLIYLFIHFNYCVVFCCMYIPTFALFLIFNRYKYYYSINTYVCFDNFYSNIASFFSHAIHKNFS